MMDDKWNIEVIARTAKEARCAYPSEDEHDFLATVGAAGGS